MEAPPLTPGAPPLTPASPGPRTFSCGAGLPRVWPSLSPGFPLAPSLLGLAACTVGRVVPRPGHGVVRAGAQVAWTHLKLPKKRSAQREPQAAGALPPPDPARRLQVASRAQPSARGPTSEEPEAADTCGLALGEPAKAQPALSSRSESLRTGLSRWLLSWSGSSPLLSLRPRAPPERCFLTRRKLLKFLCLASVYT